MLVYGRGDKFVTLDEEIWMKEVCLRFCFTRTLKPSVHLGDIQKVRSPRWGGGVDQKRTKTNKAGGGGGGLSPLCTFAFQKIVWSILFTLAVSYFRRSLEQIWKLSRKLVTWSRWKLLHSKFISINVLSISLLVIKAGFYTKHNDPCGD